MEDHICQICHVKIKPGGTFYKYKTEFISGFDGVLPETADLELDLLEALSGLDKLSEEEAMDEVYQKIELVLCPACKDKICEQIKALTPKKKIGAKIIPFPSRKKPKA